MPALRDLFTRIRFEVKTDPLDKLNKKLDGIKSRLSILAAGSLLRGLANLTSSFGSFALDMANAASAAGVTAEQLQQLGYAASKSGINTEQLSKMLGTLTKKLYAARMGNEEANIAFARAGISPEQVQGFHDSSDALKALADTLRNIEDPILRAAIAQETLGESGAKALEWMAQGSSGIAKQVGEAKQVGVTVSTQNLKMLANSERAVNLFSKQVQVLAMNFAAKLSPVIIKATTALGGWLNSHQKLINATYDKFLYNLGYAFGATRRIFESLGRIFDAFTERFPNALKYLTIFGLGLVALAGVMAPISFAIGIITDALGLVTGAFRGAMWAAKWFGLKPIVWIYQLSTAVGKVLLGAFVRLAAFVLPTMADFLALAVPVVAPFVGIAAAIAAIIVASHDLWSVWNGGKWEDTWIGQALAAAKGGAGAIWGMVKKGFGMASDVATSMGGAAVEDGKQKLATGKSIMTTLGKGANAVYEANKTPAGSRRLSASDLMGPGFQEGSGGNNVTYNVTAPVNFTVADDGTGKKLAPIVKEAHKAAWDATMRATKQALAPGALS